MTKPCCTKSRDTTVLIPAVLTEDVPLFLESVQRLPERIIERAVKGMLPKGRLGRDIRLHLKAFRGTVHPHAAQQPTDITAQVDCKPRETPGALILAAARAKVAAGQL